MQFAVPSADNASLIALVLLKAGGNTGRCAR